MVQSPWRLMTRPWISPPTPRHGSDRPRGTADAAPFVYAGAQIIRPGAFDGDTAKPFSLNVTWDRLLAQGRLAAASFALVIQANKYKCGEAAEAKRHVRVLEQRHQVAADDIRAAAEVTFGPRRKMPQVDLFRLAFLYLLRRAHRDVAIHMRLGMQVVIEDYVHSHGLKIAALVLSRFGHVVLAVAGVFAILKLGIGA